MRLRASWVALAVVVALVLLGALYAVRLTSRFGVGCNRMSATD